MPRARLHADPAAERHDVEGQADEREGSPGEGRSKGRPEGSAAEGSAAESTAAESTGEGHDEGSTCEGSTCEASVSEALDEEVRAEEALTASPANPPHASERGEATRGG